MVTARMSQERPVASVQVDQHRMVTSVLLHLLPGAALTLFVVLAAPVFDAWGFPPVFALFAGIGVVIIPIELGILLTHARRTTGSFSLRGTVVYRNRLPKRTLVPMAFGLALWFGLLLMVATASMDEWIADRFFGWIPDTIRQFSMVESAEPVSGIVLAVLIATAFLFNGLAGPLVEELYFRGFLLPRIARLGKWAPVVNTVLFSVYHFWTPWQNLTRIVGFLPITWTAWRLRSVQVAAVAHVIVNLTFLAGLLALFAGGAT